MDKELLKDILSELKELNCRLGIVEAIMSADFFGDSDNEFVDNYCRYSDNLFDILNSK